MLIAHYGLAYAAKRVAPRVPLVTLFGAALLLDLLWLFFTTVGSEQYRINEDSGTSLYRALVFISYPFSHSLLSAVLFGVLIGCLYFAWMRLWRDGLIVGLLISSHWFLDYLVHADSLPLVPWSESMNFKVGLGLWELYPYLAGGMEVLIFVVGLWLSTAQVNFTRRGRLVHLVLITTLLVVFGISFLPPPQNTIVQVLAALSFIAPLVLAWFIEKREIHEPAFHLSSPLHKINGHYDVVIVGSGYGGGIAASRLARSQKQNSEKLSVCVLERGLELHPGEYPRKARDIVRDMRITGNNTDHGDETSLFQFHKNSDMNVLVGCGLGGTSLINANVSLVPDPRVFHDACWPNVIQTEARDGGPLKTGYESALRMLKARAYPGFPALGKIKALQQSAGAFGKSAVYVPVNVAFADGINNAGVFQNECVRCGDCFSGCNYNAKTTVLMTYLPDAKKNGAEIFAEVAVRQVRPRPSGGWYVDYEPLNFSRAAYGAPSMFVTADVVILAAGTLGTTEILLRSKANGLVVSDQLGKRFSGNGDTAGFTYNAKKRIGAIGRGFLRPNRIEPGPTISAMIDLRDGAELEKGVVIQDCTIAGGLARSFSVALGMLWTFGRGEATKRGIRSSIRKLWRWLLGLLPGTAIGPLDYTQTYLVMGHDGAVGHLDLGDDDRVRVNWKPNPSHQPVVDTIDETLLKASTPLDGTYISNLARRDVLDVDNITVHPLGGCVMGDDASNGVVNHKGQVFSGDKKAKNPCLDGLYLLDGSIVPRSLGVNPLLTISALAERNVRLIAADRGWQIDDSQSSKALDETLSEMRLRFTERMTGEWVQTNVCGNTVADIRLKFENKNAKVQTMDLVLSMESDDPDKMSDPENLSNPKADCRFFGTADMPELFENNKDADANGHFVVTNGEFRLFRRKAGEGLRMDYAMHLVGPDRMQSYSVRGYKEIHDGPYQEIYEDVTTLYLWIYEVAEEREDLRGVAILRLLPVDVLQLFSSMQVIPPLRRGGSRMWLREKRTLLRFVWTFSKTIFKTYRYVWTIFAFRHPGVQRGRRPIRSGTVHYYTIETGDGVRLRLTRIRGEKSYRGNESYKGPVILAPGFGTSTFAYTLDTVRTNLPEFLINHGYDVWLLDYRASTILEASKEQFTLDKIAQEDWPAALKFVCQQTGCEKVDVVAHCVGSMSFLMAATAEPTYKFVSERVKNAVCSSLTLHPNPALWNKLKAWLFTADIFALIGVDKVSTDFKPYKLAHLLVDCAVRLLMIAGVISAKERCASPVCRRILAIYGEVYKHSNLSPSTHNAIPEMFGRGNTMAYQHLQRMFRKRHVVAFDGDETYVPHIGRIGFPITFLHGKDNEFFDKSDGRKTRDKLKEQAENNERLGESEDRKARGELKKQYEAVDISNYGHLDLFIGRNAERDVFPKILEHLSR